MAQDQRLFNHGGSGIILTRAAMSRLVDAAPRCVARYGACWAGDGMLGLCMHSVGVDPARGEGLCGDSPFDIFGAAGCEPPQPPPDHCLDRRPVSWHRIRSEWQAELLGRYDSEGGAVPIDEHLRREASAVRAGRYGAAPPGLLAWAAGLARNCTPPDPVGLRRPRWSDAADLAAAAATNAAETQTI